MGKVLMAVAGLALAAVLVKEYPSMVRYLKIERM